MLARRREKKGQKGFAIIYVALIGAFVLIPMAGLAIDFGVVYNVKARLQTACDAAAIGSGYLLHAATDLSDTTTYNSVMNTAQQFFNSNFGTTYMGASIANYTATATSSTSGKTITVNATATVPMLFMRVLGIANSTVAAEAVSNVRYISMMISVDRSGSVVREGADTTIKSALNTFVASSTSSYLVNGVDTVGMVSFGGTWNLDFSPTTSFQSGGASTIGTAITNIPFDNGNSTNTAEGLYQAWYYLYKSYLPGSLNVIVLLTDGRPSAFTSNWTPKNTHCSNTTTRGGVFETYVGSLNGSTYPYWPPVTTPNESTGLYATQYQGKPEANYLAANSTNCAYSTTNANVNQDFTGGSFPTSVGSVDNVNVGSHYPAGITAGTGLSTQTGYYSSGVGTSMTNPKNGRYAAVNAADNVATLIRSDTTLKPIIFVIGLNYSCSDTSGTSCTEPLNADWLARIANDPTYVTVAGDTDAGVTAGSSVYQSGQTTGMYCNSTITTLTTCFSQVTSALLRLTQ